MRALNDKIIVERIEAKDRTDSGIFIPDNAKEKSSIAVVVAIGPGRMLDTGQRHALDVEIGDKIVLGRYAGTEVEVGDKKYAIIREDDVLGVLEEE